VIDALLKCHWWLKYTTSPTSQSQIKSNIFAHLSSLAFSLQACCAATGAVVVTRTRLLPLPIFLSRLLAPQCSPVTSPRCWQIDRKEYYTSASVAKIIKSRAHGESEESGVYRLQSLLVRIRSADDCWNYSLLNIEHGTPEWPHLRPIFTWRRLTKPSYLFKWTALLLLVRY